MMHDPHNVWHSIAQLNLYELHVPNSSFPNQLNSHIIPADSIQWISLNGLLLIRLPGRGYLVTTCVQGYDKVATTWKFY